MDSLIHLVVHECFQSMIYPLKRTFAASSIPALFSQKSVSLSVNLTVSQSIVVSKFSRLTVSLPVSQLQSVQFSRLTDSLPVSHSQYNSVV